MKQKVITIRIDELLVAKGFAETAAKAQALVLAGVVLVRDQRVEKPSEKFPEDAPIRIKGSDDPAAKYVGRGGVKLEAALKAFSLDVTGFTCLDIGSSTGGFTDCLLQHGAKEIYAVDVGQNQLAWRLRTDKRVKLFEGLNARDLTPEFFGIKFDLIVVDVSFISVTKLLPAIVPLLKPSCRLIILAKPQFEVGKGQVPKGGVVSDPALHSEVTKMISEAAKKLGLVEQGIIESPIRGADGNQEYLILLSFQPPLH
jgi:23S rRNA (cytidine1920-2'-O)/16S rRNA (cytidine1409-2'-O)-methyltransferase